jgi:spectrin beta
MGCHYRGQELEGTLKLHEFMREAEDLQSWLASQKQVARGRENLGGDYEHVLVRGWGREDEVRQTR